MIIARNGYFGACSAQRRRLVFADIGGIVNSEDFESFDDGVISLSSITSYRFQDFESYTDGAVAMGENIMPIASQEFEVFLDGDIAATFQSLNYPFTKPITQNGKALQDKFLYSTFESSSDGTLTSFSQELSNSIILPQNTPSFKLYP